MGIAPPIGIGGCCGCGGGGGGVGSVVAVEAARVKKALERRLVELKMAVGSESSASASRASCVLRAG